MAQSNGGLFGDSIFMPQYKVTFAKLEIFPLKSNFTIVSFVMNLSFSVTLSANFTEWNYCHTNTSFTLSATAKS